VTAGSVVTTSVPKHTVVQGNPARPIAKCGVPLYPDSKYSYKDYLRNLKPY
jgi:acetyltransferase-like isoleucine patch superfamily enzyme